jgi:hypothetical protein
MIRAAVMASVVAVCMVLWATGPAAAHDVRLATTRIAVEADAVVVDTGINGVDVSRVAGENVMNAATETVDPGLFAPHEARLLGLVRAACVHGQRCHEGDHRGRVRRALHRPS